MDVDLQSNYLIQIIEVLDSLISGESVYQVDQLILFALCKMTFRAIGAFESAVIGT